MILKLLHKDCSLMSSECENGRKREVFNMGIICHRFTLKKKKKKKREWSICVCVSAGLMWVDVHVRGKVIGACKKFPPLLDWLY